MLIYPNKLNKLSKFSLLKFHYESSTKSKYPDLIASMSLTTSFNFQSEIKPDLESFYYFLNFPIVFFVES